MSARLGADAVVVLHLAFIAFVILGGLLVRVHRWIAGLHLPALAWGVWIELSHGPCPLTSVENACADRPVKPVTPVVSSSTT